MSVAPEALAPAGSTYLSTVTSKVSTGAYRSRPRTVAFSKKTRPATAASKACPSTPRPSRPQGPRTCPHHLPSYSSFNYLFLPPLERACGLGLPHSLTFLELLSWVGSENPSTSGRERARAHHIRAPTERGTEVGGCSGSEAGLYSRLIHFLYHSTLGLRAIKKKKKKVGAGRGETGRRRGTPMFGNVTALEGLHHHTKSVRAKRVGQR